jgi:Fic-DOC domain mobile mystery protein B
MMSHADGATALDPNDADDLIPTHITTRVELNAWEQANIRQALAWMSDRRSRVVLDVRFVRELHRRMFDNTWKWAGEFRRRDTNIGVHWTTISARLTELLFDAAAWYEYHSYGEDECAARLHHRLTAIHPFPNGNGRHARLFADAVLLARDRTPFSWGSGDLMGSGVVRNRYLDALRTADRGNVKPLLRFVRS